MNETTLVWLVVLLMLFGGGAGSFVTRQLEQRRADRLRRERGPEPICGCGCHYAFHDPATGHCHAQHRRPNKWDTLGDPVGWKDVPCTCRRYVGPQPLDSFYAPEISGDVVQELPRPRKETDTEH